MKICRSLTVRQLEFFQPPKVLPCWRELPREVQTEVSELLLKMIREYAKRSSHNSEGEKSNDRNE
jgi:hypothetical protein